MPKHLNYPARTPQDSLLRILTVVVVLLAGIGAAPASAATPARNLAANANVLTIGDGQSVASPSRRVVLTMQGDGNLVLKRDGAPIWATMTFVGRGGTAEMQGDGNLVVYDKRHVAAWSTGSVGYPGSRLAVQDDGNLVIYTPAGRAVWASGTQYCQTYSAGAVLCGAIRDLYNARGAERGDLGRPLGSDWIAGGGRGRGANFEYGSIYWTVLTGPAVVRGAIRDKWGSYGWENGFLGFPVSSENPTPGQPGAFSHFQGGSIYYSPRSGTHEIRGTIRDEWARQGWERGPLGFPVSDEVVAWNSSAHSRMNFFSNGSLWYGPGGVKTYGISIGAASVSAEAETAIHLPIADFTDLARNRRDRTSQLNWTNNGCSVPGWVLSAKQAYDAVFIDACVRHDFGARNYSPMSALKLDPTGPRFEFVNRLLREDSDGICQRMGNPQVPNGVRGNTRCTELSAIMHAAVRNSRCSWWDGLAICPR